MKMRSVLILLSLCLVGCASFQVDQPEECPIHHQRLREDLVMARPGSPRLEFEKAARAEFPYSGAIFTGDVAPGNQAVLQRALICPKCVQAEADWRREHFL